ncbi:DUF2358 domain containing protein [Nitzschia inconspicua]|uniref:DUF2358 domain containing protein n=1 Tax=Nitzschia inconspicua TaxID=303405 RepID=A0A9K3L1X6_9STRA|nr:DUF2358 domain containing protein [Nitzschia inconspicua]
MRSSFPSLMTLYHCKNQGEEQEDTLSKSTSALSYEDTDGASKGIVSTLTNLVNTLSNQPTIRVGEIDETASVLSIDTATSSSSRNNPPSSPNELLERLRQDYEDRNYLWTGDLDLRCFEKDCRFTDPTLSFQGIDTFAKNTKNLVPLVKAFVEDYESRLLSIELVQDNDDEASYVQTRWNMIGSVTASPWIFWKPKINVIGRTKFWFRCKKDDDGIGSTQAPPKYQVYFYDEEWEIPAHQALLQLITPAGT